MTVRTVIGIAVVVFIGVLAFKNQRNETTISKQKTTITGLNTQVADCTKVLKEKRAEVKELTSQIVDLKLDNSSLLTQNANLERDKATAVAKGYQAASGIRTVNDKLALTIQQKNAPERKLAADAEAGGVGAIGTSVKDSTLNGQVANLKGRVSNYEKKVIPDLQTALSTETTRADREERRAIKAEGEVSDLETVINGVSAKIQTDFTESKAEKHPLGIGQKKSKRRLEAKVLSRLPQR